MQFRDLEDGAEFVLPTLVAYGSKRVFVKTLEDGGRHNAVDTEQSSYGLYITDDTPVVQVNGKDNLIDQLRRSIEDEYDDFERGCMQIVTGENDVNNLEWVRPTGLIKK